MSAVSITRQVPGTAVRRHGLLEHSIALGFLLLGVVRVEPSPSDALLLAAIAVTIASGRVDLRRLPPAITGVLGVMLALNLLSAIGAIDLGRALRFMGITLYLMVFALWLCAYACTPRRIRLVMRAYVAGAATFAALTLLAFVVPFPGHEALLGESGTRAQGLFKDPNVFGPFLVPAALIVFEEILRPRLLSIERRTAAVLLAVLALGVLFAYSRAGWLNLGVALAVMVGVEALRADAGRAVAGALAVLVVIGAVVAGAVTLSGSGSFLSERARVQAYDTDRFHAQRTGVELAEEHPVGVGPGQFEVLEPISSHSLYVRVLAEQGFLGLATLALLLGGTLLVALGNAIAGRDTYGVGSAVLLGCWCGLLANSAFIDTLHWRHLWLVAALIWAAGLRRSPA